MPIDLRILADNVEEFDTLLARFSRSGDTAVAATMPEVRAAAPQPTPGTNAETPAVTTGRGRKSTPKAAEPTQEPDGTVIPPVSEPLPQPTPGGTDAPPAESIPPKQEDVAATPSAGSPANTAAVEAGEVTVQNLKDAMADLLKAKSASAAMKTLEDVAGCKSLTSGSPNVVEKAKEDPTLMRRVLDALVAAKTAA